MIRYDMLYTYNCVLFLYGFGFQYQLTERFAHGLLKLILGMWIMSECGNVGA